MLENRRSRINPTPKSAKVRIGVQDVQETMREPRVLLAIISGSNLPQRSQNKRFESLMRARPISHQFPEQPDHLLAHIFRNQRVFGGLEEVRELPGGFSKGVVCQERQLGEPLGARVRIS